MTRMHLVIGLIVVASVGCRSKSGNPETDRLEPGTEAIIVSKENSVVLWVSGTVESGVAGSRVVIIDDSAEESEPGDRFTRVSVKEGRYVGPAKTDRKYLRPIPR